MSTTIETPTEKIERELKEALVRVKDLESNNRYQRGFAAGEASAEQYMAEADELKKKLREVMNDAVYDERDQLKQQLALRFPDIGPDPLKLDGDERGARMEDCCVEKILNKARDVQQSGVPDQTALVWRFDLMKMSERVILAEARLGFAKQQLQNWQHVADEILAHQIANRGTKHAFYRCYTYGIGDMPEWVTKLSELSATPS